MRRGRLWRKHMFCRHTISKRDRGSMIKFSPSREGAEGMPGLGRRLRVYGRRSSVWRVSDGGATRDDGPKAVRPGIASLQPWLVRDVAAAESPYVTYRNCDILSMSAKMRMRRPRPPWGGEAVMLLMMRGPCVPARNASGMRNGRHLIVHLALPPEEGWPGRRTPSGYPHRRTLSPM